MSSSSILPHENADERKSRPITGTKRERSSPNSSPERIAPHGRPSSYSSPPKKSPFIGQPLRVVKKTNVQAQDTSAPIPVVETEESKPTLAASTLSDVDPKVTLSVTISEQKVEPTEKPNGGKVVKRSRLNKKRSISLSGLPTKAKGLRRPIDIPSNIPEHFLFSLSSPAALASPAPPRPEWLTSSYPLSNHFEERYANSTPEDDFEGKHERIFDFSSLWILLSFFTVYFFFVFTLTHSTRASLLGAISDPFFTPSLENMGNYPLAPLILQAAFSLNRVFGASARAGMVSRVSPNASALPPYYTPSSNDINNLDLVLTSEGAPGIYNSSLTSEGDYGVYNGCNMPHVRKKEYVYVQPSPLP